jgi:hypothetical protein
MRGVKELRFDEDQYVGPETASSQKENMNSIEVELLSDSLPG